MACGAHHRLEVVAVLLHGLEDQFLFREELAALQAA